MKGHNIVDMPKRQATSRIIAGKFRGTRISFKESKALRPTESKTKETLFNWLMNDLENKDCLDEYIDYAWNHISKLKIEQNAEFKDTKINNKDILRNFINCNFSLLNIWGALCTPFHLMCTTYLRFSLVILSQLF